MPLSKGSSQKSFVKNLKTELEHGKPMKQSLAIAYAMKRKSKKMAKGGALSDKDRYQRSGADKGMSPQGGHVRASNRAGDWAKDPRASGPSIEREMSRESMHKAKEIAAERLFAEHDRPNPKLKGLADGGPVVDPTQRPYSATNSSIAQGIAGLGKHAEGGEVHKDGDGLVDRIIKRMSEGGRVANDTLEDIDDTPAQYDDLVLDDGLEPDFSGPGNEIGDEAEDDDQKDIVSRVMSSRRKKDRMPNPA